MKTNTYLAVRRLSILTILFLLSSAILTAQGIKIRERVEIAPRASMNASEQPSDLLPSFQCTVPFSGPGVLWIVGFDNIFEGHARLTMNGQTIVEDIYNQVYGLWELRIDLGNHENGDLLTFEMIDPSNGIIRQAQECWSSENTCSASHSVNFTDVPICGQEFGGHYPSNVEVLIGFANAQEMAKIVLQPAWEGSILFKEPTLLSADNKSLCTGGFIDLPEGTTFSFNISEGQEHAILYDIYSGNEGVSLSGIPKDGNSGWIRLKAIGDEPSQPVNITIEAKTTVGNTCVFHITILPDDLKIIPTKSVITYGDTLRFDVWKKLSETTYGPLEPGMAYAYSIVEGYDASYLFSPDGSQASEYVIDGDFSSSIFAAYENTPQGNSTLVKLKAMAWVPAPPPPPCDDCNANNIKPNNPLPVTNGPMLKRSAGKIYAVPQLSKSNSIPMEKNAGTGPTGINNKTGTHTVPVVIEKPQLASLHKNADGSYSFVQRDTTGARLSSNNVDKVFNRQTGNSSQTVLRKNAYGGYSPEKINPITSKVGPSVTGTQYDPSDGRLAGIVTIEVVKPSDILLGETKYYTAKPDPDQFSNLIITESSSSDLGDGDERVIFEDPQIADDAVNNDTIGAYWDYMKPDNTGLDNGVVRLIGKRWKPDTTYKVKLHAVLEELGREGAVEIEVKTGCIHAAFAKTPLSVEDTTALVFTYSDTGIPVPLDKILDVSIMYADGTNGCLLDSLGDKNVVFNAKTQPLWYIAPDSIRGDSLVVNINAVASAPSSSYASGRGGQIVPQISANIKIENNAEVMSIKGPKGSIIKPQALSQATLKSLQEQTCEIKAGAVKNVDHFEVTLETDDIAFTESPKIFVKAKDKDNNDVNLRDQAVIQLQLGGETAYGTFIKPNGDTLKTSQVFFNLTYGEARTGKAKFAAVVLNPENVANLKIIAVLVSDNTKFGGKELVVKEQTLKIVMDPPYEIRPSIPGENRQNKTFAVRLTRGGILKGDHPFRLITNYVNRSGGHDHINVRSNMDDNYGTFQSRQADQRIARPMDDLTQSDIMPAYDYISSIFGDTMKICLRSMITPLLCDSLKIVEKVPGLIDFKRYHPPTEQMYIFAQLDPNSAMRHPDNNWCSSIFADSLQLAIFDFYNWSLSEEGVAVILSLNDMSLQLGGRYDIDALWELSILDPNSPHQRHYYHRTGTSVDINPPLSAEQLENLERYMNNYQLVRNRERQIHFGFNEEY